MHIGLTHHVYIRVPSHAHAHIQKYENTPNYVHLKVRHHYSQKRCFMTKVCQGYQQLLRQGKEVRGIEKQKT